jgi:hypothetical protein
LGGEDGATKPQRCKGKGGGGREEVLSSGPASTTFPVRATSGERDTGGEYHLRELQARFQVMEHGSGLRVLPNDVKQLGDAMSAHALCAQSKRAGGDWERLHAHMVPHVRGAGRGVGGGCVCVRGGGGKGGGR